MCSEVEGCKSKTPLSPANRLTQQQAGVCMQRLGNTIAQPLMEADTQLHLTGDINWAGTW